VPVGLAFGEAQRGEEVRFRSAYGYEEENVVELNRHGMLAESRSLPWRSAEAASVLSSTYWIVLPIASFCPTICCPVHYRRSEMEHQPESALNRRRGA